MIDGLEFGNSVPLNKTEFRDSYEDLVIINDENMQPSFTGAEVVICPR